MDKFVFFGVFVFSMLCVCCANEEKTQNVFMRNQVKNLNYASENESNVQDLTCACHFQRKCQRKRGCYITVRAPPGYACYCTYMGSWKCSGKVVECKDPDDFYCKHPDRSKKSCLQSGGDCNGYCNSEKQWQC